ncbi:MAG TPA: glycosyltransferase family 2 protein [Chthoniobacterales bacterium]|jgi:dolichol-phosphate mannosyltransferase|nr:glycosyltransferase family 2 protein [Chthoniobacterales bacterium]
MSYIVSVFAAAQKPSLAFVIPVKDEQATLVTLFRGIADEANKITDVWEVIFVDDGSTDGSWTVIQQLAADNLQHVKAIRFRCNAGKAAALAAGWKASRGEIVFTMDADLQDDPKEIPRFLGKMSEGFDVVTGWKRERHDPWHKVLPSRVFNFVLSRVNKVELHDHNCGFKCYRRQVIESLPMYGEMHRMVPSLAAMHGLIDLKRLLLAGLPGTVANLAAPLLVIVEMRAPIVPVHPRRRNAKGADSKHFFVPN